MITDEAITAVHGAFTKDWRSAAWWLERNHPDRYSLRPDLRPIPAREGQVTTQKELDDLLAGSPEFRAEVKRTLDRAEQANASE